MKKFMKNNLKTITAFIIGIVVSCGVVYAANLSANQVTYDNSASGLKNSNNQNVTDVQTAIDILYSKANSGGSLGAGSFYIPSPYIDDLQTYFKPYSNYHDLIDDVGGSIFVKYDNGNLSLCGYVSSIGDGKKLVCIDKADDSSTIISNAISAFEAAFGAGSCRNYDDDYKCSNCIIDSDGYVRCPEYEECVFDSTNNSFNCESGEHNFINFFCNVYSESTIIACQTNESSNNYGYLYDSLYSAN